MNPQLANLLRLVLAMLGARLATKGLIEPGSESQFADYAVNLVGAATTFGALFSAFKNVRRQGALLNTALALPAYSTAFDLKASGQTNGSGWKDYLVRQAISTVLMILGDDLSKKKYGQLLIRLRDELNAVWPPDSRAFTPARTPHRGSS